VERTCAKHPERESVSFCVKCGMPLCPECERPFNGRPYCAGCLKKRKKDERGANLGAVGSRIAGVAGGVGTAVSDAKNRSTAAIAERGTSVLPKEVARLFAKLIDIGAVLLLSLLVHIPIRLASQIWMPDVSGTGFILSFYLSLLMVSAIYFVVSEWRYGRTIGKWVFGLKVVRYGKGGTPGFSAVIWRWIGFLTGCVWAYSGFWLMRNMAKWIVYFRGKIPDFLIAFTGLIALAGVAIFSLGLLITFVGKYKRGFHDLLGGTIVEWSPREKRRSKDESKTGKVPVG
jgi:uncharacterized RDD family membrane protein YckC